MKLIKVTDRIWYYPFEKERDRPILGYIKGDNWSLAVDAGHSEAHTMEFYSALKEADLPLPELTVLTHWHWDHTFGMHSVNGLCISNQLTESHLKYFKEKNRQKRC
jgi:metal-dependent hydrolase (beta-lactamase superfamily II)